ncbi:MAG: hypothetical protein EPO08_15835 [Rhodospirillaceae bacterium]|nr:MAG: hypothetical protein EPO08_15835 [Rhodospirillaceae bacterium]
MSVTSVAGSASLTPPHPSRANGIHGPRPVVTAAPFSPTAQKQADAINTGRQPHRGHVVNIVV